MGTLQKSKFKKVKIPKGKYYLPRMRNYVHTGKTMHQTTLLKYSNKILTLKI
jgi:hypothetical protein